MIKRILRSNSISISQLTWHRKHAAMFSTSDKIEEAKQKFRTATAVCLDVDSTVSMDEGIDVLAAFKGVGTEVAEYTTKAMNGSIPFNEALSTRLGLIKPSLEDLSNCLRANPPRLTSGVEKLISRLHAKGVHVYLVSGGFRQLIAPIAQKLRIPSHRVYANNIVFDGQGQYLGFDATELTSKDHGKRLVVKMLKESLGYSSVIMIGDGATDMQAKPPADVFIGYGGVVERDSIKANADWYIYNFEELTQELPF